MFLLLFVLKNVAQPYFSRKCLLPPSRISAVNLVSGLNSGNPDISRNFCLAI